MKSKTRTLIALSMAFLILSSKAFSDSSCIPFSTPDCTCYSLKDRQKIADALVDWEKCKISLEEKNRLIEEKLITFDAGPAWWQEPSFVLGSTVVSFSLGMALGFYIVHK